MAEVHVDGIRVYENQYRPKGEAGLTLLEALVVRPSIERFGESGVSAAATMVGGGKTGGGAGSVLSRCQRSGGLGVDLAVVIAWIHLKMRVCTQSARRNARWQATRYDYHLALLTPSGKTELRRKGIGLAQRARSKFGSKRPSTARRKD